MLSGLFQSTTIPVLQEVVSFAQARHAVLAGNIANMDTPGYQVRDLSVEDFQGRLRAAIQQRHVGQVANLPLFRQVGNLPHELRWKKSRTRSLPWNPGRLESSPASTPDWA